MTFSHRISSARLQASLALLATLTALQAHAAPTYQLSTIDSTLQLPQMNASGTIVGQLQSQWGIFQNGQTQVIDLPTGTTYSYAQAINDQGTVLGGAYRSTVVGGGLEHAGYTVTDNYQQFLYKDGQVTNMQQIIGLPSVSTVPGGSAWVADINNSGELAGTINGENSASSDAFVYRNGQMQTIATPDKWTSVTAYSINNLGVVLGAYAYLNSANSQYVNGLFLDDHGQLTDLGLPGGNAANVRGFNDKGQILLSGNSGTVIYGNGGLTTLNAGNTADPSTFFDAFGLGGDGTVIAHTLSDTYSFTPVLYANGQRLDPNTLIDAQSASQHHITDLLSINEQGTIVAIDQNGQQLLLKPLSAVPETSTLNLMALGLALAGVCRLRARIKRARPGAWATN